MHSEHFKQSANITSRKMSIKMLHCTATINLSSADPEGGTGGPDPPPPPPPPPPRKITSYIGFYRE